MADYFDGAVMAYRDCADLMRKMDNDAPEGEKFFLLKSALQMLAQGFDAKANEVISKVQKAKAGS